MATPEERKISALKSWILLCKITENQTKAKKYATQLVEAGIEATSQLKRNIESDENFFASIGFEATVALENKFRSALSLPRIKKVILISITAHYWYILML